MKKSTFFLIAVLISTHTLKSQDYFEQLPFPDSTTIYDLAFSQQGEIFAAVLSLKVIPNDGVYKSSDSGQTWNMILSVGQAGCTDIDLNNVGDLYALVGQDLDDCILKSIDNGETWNGIHVPIDSSWGNSGLFIQGIDTLFVGQCTGSVSRLLRSYNDGITWDTVFYRTGYSSESIVDLAFGHNGEIFMAISGFMVGNGGLFKSVDNGDTWSLFGLQGNMVNDISYNSNGDLFIASQDGPYGWGLFTVFHENNVVTPATLGWSFSSVVVNGSDDIFAGLFDGGNVYHTSDDGNTYEWISSGLSVYAHILSMFIDHQEYIYVKGYGNILYRSVQPTITSVTNIESNNSIRIFPNPCNEVIQGQIDNDFNVNIEYEVYNLKGEKTLWGLTKIDDGYFSIDSSSLKPGMYYLIMDTREVYSTKFIKR